MKLLSLTCFQVGLLVSFLSLNGCLPLTATQSADTVLINGNIHTMDSTRPEAEALAILDGVIVEVGNQSSIEQHIGRKTKVIDAQGKIVLPGFNDAHLHPMPIYDEMGPYGTLDLTPEGGVTSLDTLLSKVAEKTAATPPGQVIFGFGYNDNLVGGHPKATVLDTVSPQHPIVLVHSSGHRGIVNTMALIEAGITDETPDTPGSQIVRDENGKATGVMLEQVPQIVALFARKLEPDTAAQAAAYQRQFDQFFSFGITSIGDASTTPDQMHVYRELGRQGMPMRIHAMVLDRHLDWVKQHKDLPEWDLTTLKIDGIKIFHGNSLSGRTAWLYEPYAHDETYFGVPPGRTQKTLDHLIQHVHDLGLQACVHANGDREIDMVLEAIELAQAQTTRPDPRHRIEHGSVSSQRILERMKAAGVALAPHSYVLNHGEKMEDYGAARWNWMHPTKSALDMGLLVGGNSDHPISPPNVMQRIQSMVTRKARSNGKIYGAKQRVSVAEAIRIWTLGSASLQGEEDVKGSLSQGKYADLIILSDNPFKAPEDTLETIAVELTMIGGNIVFDRTGQYESQDSQLSSPPKEAR